MLRQSTLIVIAALTGLTAGEVYAQSAAERVFESVFGQRAREVAVTREKTDDIELAAQLVDAAEHAGEADVQRYLIAKAFDLARRDTTGYPVAFEAADTLERLIPDARAEAAEMRMGLYELQYRSASRDERPAAALAYLRALQATGEATIADKPESAAADFRKAIPVATAAGVERPVQDYLRERISTATARATVLRRQEQLSQRLRQSPTDKAVIDELITLLVVERNDPAAAELLLDRTDNAMLKGVVKALTKPIERNNAEALRTTADWLYDAAQTNGVTAIAKRQMLERALAFYQQRLAKDDRDTMATLKVDLIKRNLETLMPIAIGSPEVPEATDAADTGRIVMIDTLAGGKGTRRGAWNVSQSSIRGEGRGMLVFPVRPTPPVEVTFTMAMGSGARPGLSLPVGDNAVVIMFDSQRDMVRLAHTRGEFRRGGAERFEADLSNGEHKIIARVTQGQGANMRVEVHVGEQMAVEWEGPISDLDNRRSERVEQGVALNNDEGVVVVSHMALRAAAVEMLE